MRVVGRSVGSVAVSSGSALNELLNFISCSHCFFSVTSVFFSLANGVTLCFFAGSCYRQAFFVMCWFIAPVIGLWYFHVNVFFSASVEPVALFIKYVSPVLVIFIGGICMIPRFVDGRLLYRFLFPLAALSLKHCLARPLGRLHRRIWFRNLSGLQLLSSVIPLTTASVWTRISTEPIFQSVLREVAILLLSKLKKELDKLVKYIMPEPVNCPTEWCSPMVIVPK